MRGARFIPALLLVVGCSHYGWAGDQRRADAPTVAVTTIGAGADHMIAQELATTRLAEALVREGLDARWAAPAEGVAAVRCEVIRLETIGVGDTLSATIVLGCQLALGQARWQVEAPGDAVVGYRQSSAPAPITLTREVETLALTRAVDAIAPRIARLLLSPTVRDYGRQATPR